MVVLGEHPLLEIGRFIVTGRDGKRAALDVGGVEAGVEEVWTELIPRAVQHAPVVLDEGNPDKNGVQVF